MYPNIKEGDAVHMLERKDAPGHLDFPHRQHLFKENIKHVEAEFLGDGNGFKVVGPWHGKIEPETPNDVHNMNKKQVIKYIEHDLGMKLTSKQRLMRVGDVRDLAIELEESNAEIAMAQSNVKPNTFSKG